MGYPSITRIPEQEELEQAERLAVRVAVRMTSIEPRELHEKMCDHLCTADFGQILLAFRLADYTKLGEILWEGVAEQIVAEEDGK